MFDHVGFAYNSGETVLRDVSFTAKQGEVTALVGPSGGGKTTVSRLAARFWDYQKGRITVGGMDVSRIDPEKLMSLYSIVFQDVTLFDNTILETSVWGARVPPTRRSLRRQSWQTAKNLTEKLPDKWNTNIGENGCALSGGERQRISIARQHRDLFQIRHTANGVLYHLGQNALVVVVVELTAPCLLIVGSTRLQLDIVPVVGILPLQHRFYKEVRAAVLVLGEMTPRRYRRTVCQLMVQNCFNLSFSST